MKYLSQIKDMLAKRAERAEKIIAECSGSLPDSSSVIPNPPVASTASYSDYANGDWEKEYRRKQSEPHDSPYAGGYAASSRRHIPSGGTYGGPMSPSNFPSSAPLIHTIRGKTY